MIMCFLEKGLTLAHLHRWVVPVMIPNVRLEEQICRCCRLQRIDEKGSKNTSRINRGQKLEEFVVMLPG